MTELASEGEGTGPRTAMADGEAEVVERVAAAAGRSDADTPADAGSPRDAGKVVAKDTDPGDQALPTAGQLLRRAREAAGMHIAALAVAIKVPVKKLELLEADRLDALPDAVFARALAGSVCRALRVDPGPILERLPDPSRPRLVPDGAGLNAPFRGPNADGRANRLANVPRPVRWVVLVVLLAALALWLLPLAAPDRAPGEATTVIDTAPRAEAPASPAHPSAAVAPLTPPVPSLAVEQQKVAGVTGVVTPANDGRAGPRAAVATQDTQQPAVVVTRPAEPTLPAGPAPAPAATAVRSTPTVVSPTQVVTAAPAGIVVFSARGASWVEVIDARGAVVLSRLLMPGETVGAGGTTPLSVVVGRADATDVAVRGKPFDLAAVARSNVARFEVK